MKADYTRFGNHRSVKIVSHHQVGMTLIELVIALAITALIASGITAAIAQVFNMNARSSNHMIAVRQVQNAGYWLTRDTVMASSGDITLLDINPAQPQLFLNWRSDPNTWHQTVYTYDSTTGILWRSTDGNENTRIAEHLTTMTITPTIDNGITNLLNFDIVANVTARNINGHEERHYEASPRPRIID